LRKAIIQELKYPERKQKYGRGKEHDLIADLANAIASTCEKPYPVDPVLASLLLLRIGLDRFCSDRSPGIGFWTLADAMGINHRAADSAAKRGHRLFAFWELERSANRV
jgi:hypothetical protein